MDNASYHSTKLIPKANANKQTMYDWIKKYTGKPGVDVELPEDIKKIRRWELQELVKQISELPSMANEIFAIDQMTAARGHQVLRLPPYNCDLNVIGMSLIIN